MMLNICVKSFIKSAFINIYISLKLSTMPLYINTQFPAGLAYWPMHHIVYWTSVTTIDLWLDTLTFVQM